MYLIEIEFCDAGINVEQKIIIVDRLTKVAPLQRNWNMKMERERQ